MAKMSEATKAKAKEAARHPVIWLKGADLPEEQIRPWEAFIQFWGEGLKGFMGGFSSMRNRLYTGMGEGKIPPNWISVQSVINMLWDGFNDPMIGSYMDRKNFSAGIHRKVMRFNATYSPINILLLCFSFGLTPLQRVVMWAIMGIFADVVSTTNAVSESKIWAGITPHSKQRGIVQLWKTLGNQLSQGISSVPILIMGLRDVLGITDYQIMIVGASIFAPLTILARWLPSLAKQRVDFSKTAEGEEEKKLPSLRESFAVVKHNRWFIMGVVISFIRLLAPGTDSMFLYRFLLPKMQLGRHEIGGELIFFIKNFLVAVPGTILQPFALSFIRRFGGELNMVRVKSAMEFVTFGAKFLVGYRTFPRLMFNYVMEMFHDIVDRWETVASRQVDYLMLDYVEWKTGLRSEGMTMAVSGFLNKLIRNNISTVIGNAVTQWTGYLGYDIPVEEQPERFLKSVWPLMHIGKLLSSLCWLIGLFWFKFPADRNQVEADLIERRALEKQKAEEANVEAGA